MASIATKQDVYAAYNIILSREIDPGASDAWDHRLAEGPVSTDALRDELLRSKEFSSQWGAHWVYVDAGGVDVCVDSREPDFGTFIVEHKQWEPHIVALVRSLLPPGATFVDVGANVGMMSFHAAQVVGPTGKVIAFEPNPANVQSFLKGLQHNDLENIILYPFGLSSIPALFSLMGSSNAFLASPDEESALAQCFRGDDFLLHEKRIDLVKIDIEGHEPHALAGMQKTIDAHHPTVICEFNPRCLQEHIGKDPQEFAESLFSFTDDVAVIHHNGSEEIRFSVSAGDQLMRKWREHSDIATESGRLPDGMLHFDLMFAT